MLSVLACILMKRTMHQQQRKLAMEESWEKSIQAPFSGERLATLGLVGDIFPQDFLRPDVPIRSMSSLAGLGAGAE